MSDPPEAYEEVARLISALLDEHLTTQERARLYSLLETDAAARKLYIQMVDQEIELPCLVVSEAALAELDRLPAVPMLRPRTDFQTRQWLWALAAMIVLAAALLALLLPPKWRSSEAVDASPPVPKSLDQIARPSVPARQLDLSNAWAENFESGTATGWIGRLISEGLPAGSRFGVAPVPMQYPNGVAYGIKLPEDWEQGLFQLTPRSTLHLTYRLNSPGGMNVFMHSIPSGPEVAGNEYHMYHLRNTRAFSSMGPWQTASIPFAQFVRKIPVGPNKDLQFVGGPPEAGESATTLIFSSPNELELVIDRVWITPDGSGREDIVPIGN